MSNIVSFDDYLLGIQKNNDDSIKDLRIPTEFDWLLTDYTENKWEVRDPVSNKSPGTVNLQFDGPMITGGKLSEHPTYIHDAKLALCMAVEVSAFNGISRVGSKSKMRNFVNSYKRIFNERLHLGFESWDRWELKNSVALLELLPYKASFTQCYLKQLKNYVKNKGVNTIPIKELPNGPADKIDTTAIFNSLGLDYYQVRYDTEVKIFLNELTDSVSEVYKKKPLQKFFLPKKETDKVNKKQYEDSLNVLSKLGALCDLFPDAFLDRCPSNIVIDSLDHLQAIDFKNSSRGRTRNIPVPVFIKVMDAACRYVLDYAGPLFDAEIKLKNEFSILKDSRGSYTAGRELNKYAKKLGLLKDGPFTPFPLAAYKHFMKRDTTIPIHEVEQFEQMMVDGFRPFDVMEKLGLTKAQFDGRRYRYLENINGPKLSHKGLSLQKALYQFLPLSCLLILFAFSGRREHEIFGLTVKDYSENESVWSINFYIGKTDRAKDTFFHTALVGKALKTLERLSHDGRRISGSDSLFRFNDTFERAPLNMDRLVTAMDSFQEFIGCEHDENGERFKFSEHQFRRFFAMMYFYRYEKGGDFDALMSEFRHTDWTMIQTYLTEKESGRIFREVEKDYLAYKLEASLDDDSIYGQLARDFKDKLSGVSGINVVPEKMKELALSVIEEGQLTLEFISEGLCLGYSPGRKHLSNCFSDGHVMCHKASSEMCEGCPNLIGVRDIKETLSSSADINEDFHDSIILNAVLGDKSDE
jgi:integrase